MTSHLAEAASNTLRPLSAEWHADDRAPRGDNEIGPSLAAMWLQAFAYWLKGKRLLAVAAVMICASLWFNWAWLASAGIAPILRWVLPCPVMCALGMYLNHGQEWGDDLS